MENKTTEKKEWITPDLVEELDISDTSANPPSTGADGSGYAS